MLMFLLAIVGRVVLKAIMCFIGVCVYKRACVYVSWSGLISNRCLCVCAWVCLNPSMLAKEVFRAREPSGSCVLWR